MITSGQIGQGFLVSQYLIRKLHQAGNHGPGQGIAGTSGHRAGKAIAGIRRKRWRGLFELPLLPVAAWTKFALRARGEGKCREAFEQFALVECTNVGVLDVLNVLKEARLDVATRDATTGRKIPSWPTRWV